MDTVYSRNMGYLDATSTQRILDLLQSLVSICLRTKCFIRARMNPLFFSKVWKSSKHLGGELAITLVKAIGEGFEVHEVNLPRMIDAIYELRERHAQVRRTLPA